MVLLSLAASWSSVSALEYVPGYYNGTSLVNGSFLLAPSLRMYGRPEWTPFIAETAMWYENYTGKALVVNRVIFGISPEQTIRRALQNGTKHGIGPPIAIFTVSALGLGGFGRVARDYSDMSWVKIPTLDISLAVWMLCEGISDRGYPMKLAFLIRDDDIGPVEGAWNFGYVVVSSALLTALVLCCFMINIYKFVLHIRYTDGVTTAKTFFAVDLLANLMRFWFVSVNPHWTAGFDYTFTTICSQTHVALSVICTLLLALKWRELLLRSSLRVSVFLTTFKWPFIIVGAIVFIFELVASALRGHWFSILSVTKVSTSFLLIVAFICAFLLFISGIQIWKHISKAVTVYDTLYHLKRTTILILLSSFGIAFWSVLQIAYLIIVFAKPVIGSTTSLIYRVQLITVLGMAGLLISSLLQNIAMPIPSDFLAIKTSSLYGRSTLASSSIGSKSHVTSRAAMSRLSVHSASAYASSAAPSPTSGDIESGGRRYPDSARSEENNFQKKSPESRSDGIGKDKSKKESDGKKARFEDDGTIPLDAKDRRKKEKKEKESAKNRVQKSQKLPSSDTSTPGQAPDIENQKYRSSGSSWSEEESE